MKSARKPLQFFVVFFSAAFMEEPVFAYETDDSVQDITHTEDHHGEEDDAHDSSHGDEHEHTFAVGAKGIYLLGFAHHEIHHFGGVSLFFEWIAIPRWLELELSSKVLIEPHRLLVPVDILIKMPFHVNQVFYPFIGIGPAMVVSVYEETEVFWGGIFALGGYFWVAPSWALIVEFNYGLFYEHGIAQEVAVNFGVGYGW